MTGAALRPSFGLCHITHFAPTLCDSAPAGLLTLIPLFLSSPSVNNNPARPFSPKSSFFGGVGKKNRTKKMLSVHKQTPPTQHCHKANTPLLHPCCPPTVTTLGRLVSVSGGCGETRGRGVGAFNPGGVLSEGSLGRRFPDQVLEQVPGPVSLELHDNLISTKGRI